MLQALLEPKSGAPAHLVLRFEDIGEISIGNGIRDPRCLFRIARREPDLDHIGEADAPDIEIAPQPVDQEFVLERLRPLHLTR